MMFSKFNNILKAACFTVLVVGAVSCNDAILEPSEESAANSSPLVTKAVNSSEGAAQDMLLIYMDSASAANVESGVINTELEALDVKSFERAIPASDNDERLAPYGLDKWYVVELNEGKDLVKEAERIACSPAVTKIQFNKLLDNVEKVQMYAAEPRPETKSVIDDAFSRYNDPLFNQQWHFINVGDTKLSPNARVGADINVKDAWNLTTGDPRVVVAVLDAGVQYNHPDLAANMWVNKAELNGKPGVDDDNNGYIDDIHGFNFISKTSKIVYDSNESDMHGSHVAGTIAAVNNNGIGVSSIAGGSGHGDGVKIMTCQILEGGKGGGTLHVGRAAVYAADNGASIIQGSYGFLAGQIQADRQYERDYDYEYQAYKYFIENAKSCDALKGKGGVMIMSSGNEAYPAACYPGAHRDIISVSSVAIDGLPADYTNYGPGCNIAAPGGEVTYRMPYTGVLSTIPSKFNGSEYGFMQGTSMACPHVSGVAALGLSYALKIGRSFTPEEFKSLICTSVSELNSRLEGVREFNGEKIPLERYRNNMGSGVIDAWSLLMAIDGVPCTQVTVGEDVVLDLNEYFGADAQYLDYIEVTCDDAARESLGLVKDPYVKFGRLCINCTKVGNGKLVIKALCGGEALGDKDSVGGSVIEREISIMSRNQKVSANGGWL